MRWSRMAAAAVLLLAFSVIGWLFLGDGDMRKEPVAVVQPPQANKPSVTDAGKSRPTKEVNDNTGDGEIAPRSADKANSAPGGVNKEKENEKEHIKQADNNTTKESNNENTQNDIPEIINEPDMAKIEPTENFPEAATITHDVVTSEPVKEIIDVQVEPRAMV